MAGLSRTHTAGIHRRVDGFHSDIERRRCEFVCTDIRGAGIARVAVVVGSNCSNRLRLAVDPVVAREAEHAAWKQDVLTGAIKLEDIDTDPFNFKARLKPSLPPSDEARDMISGAGGRPASPRIT